MRALVVKELTLDGIGLHTVLEGDFIEGVFFAHNYGEIPLNDIILEGARWQVVKAAEEGKGVEVWESETGKWRTKKHDSWRSTSFYRIAPEPPQPQYVPFTASDWEMFVGKGIKVPGMRMGIVLQWDKDDVLIAEDWRSYENAFKKCTFLDGSPFGKIVS